ncbi:MAG: lysophospholipase L1-like esterase [Glaciecola sp.]|jgi:lysophospholipase L1-like esterase
MSTNKHKSQQKNIAAKQNTLKQSRPIFYLIAIALPFVLLLLLEGILRLSNFGHHYPLFIESSYSEGYLQPNPEVVKRFFHKAEFAPPVGPDTYLFKREKAADSIRIVFMGGSTAAGFPYGRFGSPAGMLNQRLKAQFPNRNIEIISVAMASINSYALLDFVDEVIAIEPDAVLIYAGHNEYLGIMGVGSVYASNGSHAANLLFLKLKDLRLFQLIQTFYYALFDDALSDNSFGANSSDSSRTVMASVAKEKAIPFDSTLFNQGVQQFEQNLQAISSSFNKAKIPLFLSSIASNEKDLSPFSSFNSPEVDKLLNTQKPRSQRRIIQQGQAILAKGTHSADLAYKVAQAMLAEGDEKAVDYFQLARDYDLLRFRAPSLFNTIIEKVVAQNPDAVLVNSEQFIRDDSSDALIGSDHMLEHLHPNPRGYFLIAEAFYQAILNNNEKLNLSDIKLINKVAIGRDQAWRNIPLSKVDELVADYKIETLMSDYPFRSSKKAVAAPKNNTALESLAKRRIEGEPWLTGQPELLVLLQNQNNIAEAALAAALLFDALPNEIEAARVASLLYLKSNELGLAEYYARRTLAVSKLNNKQMQNIDSNYYLTLAEIIFKSGNTNEAIAILDELLSMQPNNQRARAIKQQIQ